METRALTMVADDQQGAINAYAWSPNGGHLAFILSEVTGFGSIHIWSVGDETPHRVTSELFNEFDLAFVIDTTGSMGGLMAIRKGVCHIAGTHLLDTEDGSYNVSYLKKYLPETDVRLVHLVRRDQGLIVPRGNPKGITGIEDLIRDDVSMINRQGGSGTRILLDYRLSALGLDPAAIAGYTNEEYTHMSVAVAVLSGAADVGLGIYAAANALDLDFIPVVTEQYDLAIPAEFMDHGNIRVLLDTIRSEAFKRRVSELGGYHTDATGEEIPIA